MSKTTPVIAGLALLAAAGAVAFAKGEEPKPSVQYAKSWEKAVEEGKRLNVPLVVHSHGFY